MREHVPFVNVADGGIYDIKRLKMLQGKARVTPLKTVSVPRLELIAALVSAKVNDEVKRELDFEITKETFWTDSQIALAYISNDSKRFHAYVANRVS